LLVAWCRICLGKLFLERRNAALGIRDSLLQHENTLDQQVRRNGNLSDLAPNQLLSLGILGLATRLAQPIEETGNEILFFWCHKLRKTLFSTLTSSG
jgi:hypothetical protein